MQVKIFDISSRGGEESIEQMNKFIRGHKVLDIDRQFYVSSDNVGHWSVFVTYLSQSGASPKKTAVFSASRVKTQFYASETASIAEKQCLFSDSCHCAAGMRAGLCWLLSA